MQASFEQFLKVLATLDNGGRGQDQEGREEAEEGEGEKAQCEGGEKVRG